MSEEKTLSQRIAAQNVEFEAVQRLSKQYRRITLTAPVDNDYPEVRHGYESAIQQLIAALRLNGRI